MQKNIYREALMGIGVDKYNEAMLKKFDSIKSELTTCGICGRLYINSCICDDTEEYPNAQDVWNIAVHEICDNSKISPVNVSFTKEFSSPEQLAQWVIDNRYAKSENEKVSDFEMYNTILNAFSQMTSRVLVTMYPMKCDACGCHPSVVVTTQHGTFCAEHAKY